MCKATHSKSVVRAMVHHKLVIDTLRLSLLSLRLENLLSLLRLLRTHLRIMLRSCTRVRQLDGLDAVGILQRGRVRDETANSNSLAIVKSVLGQVMAEFRDELSAPTEPRRAHVQILGFVLLQCLQPVEHSRSSDGVPAEEQEGDEVAHHVCYMADLFDLVQDA